LKKIKLGFLCPRADELRCSFAKLRAELRAGLGSELAQMMIQMLVHQDRPFVRGKRAEKCVRMRGATRSPSSGEAIDQPAQALPLGFKVPILSDYNKLF
jgi:hypothetical protein